MKFLLLFGSITTKLTPESSTSHLLASRLLRSAGPSLRIVSGKKYTGNGSSSATRLRVFLLLQLRIGNADPVSGVAGFEECENTPKTFGASRQRIGLRAGRQAQINAALFSMTDHRKASTSSQVVSTYEPKLMRYRMRTMLMIVALDGQ